MDFKLQRTIDYLFITVVIGFIFGAGSWKSDVEGDVIGMRKDISAINQELVFRAGIRNEIMKRLDSIDQRLSRIEGRLYR